MKKSFLTIAENRYNYIFLIALFLSLSVTLPGCDTPAGSTGGQEQTLESGKVATAEAKGYNVEVTDLSPLRAHDINDDGQIVGTKEIEPGVTRGFLWEDGKVTLLEPLPGDVQSSAIAINNNGRVIGRSRNNDGSSKPVSWQDGKLCRLCTLKRGTFIRDINDERQILGSGDGEYFVFKNGKFTYFDFTSPTVPFGNLSINNSGVVAGTREYDPPGFTEAISQAFIWVDGEFSSVGGSGSSSWAYDINDRNQVVGLTGNSPFIWENGESANIGSLGGGGGVATGINDRGQIVGASQTNSGDWHVFLWENETMIDLGVEAAEDPNTSANFISDFEINNRGQIIGEVRTTSGPNRNILIEIERK